MRQYEWNFISQITNQKIVKGIVLWERSWNKNECHFVSEQPPLQSQVQKSGMEKSQPYLIIACVIVGCIIMFLLCYLSFRIISAKNGQPGIDNPQEVGKVSYPGSLPGHAGGNVPYAGSRMTGPTPPPGYSTGVQPRTRLTSTPGQYLRVDKYSEHLLRWMINYQGW